MYEQVEKPKENKSRAVANSVTQNKNNGKQGFVDNRQKHPIHSQMTQAIQREVNFGVDGAGNINNVIADRGNMETFFNGNQGDHTTAFTVYNAMFRNRLTGQTLANAFAALQAIDVEIMALPGVVNLVDAPDWAQDIFNQELNDVNNARAAVTALAPTRLELVDYATALLSLRNVVPLSALEFGGVGHGEGHAQVHLNNLNNELGAGNPFNHARQQTLTNNATILLDTNAVDQINVNPINNWDQEIFPGLTNNIGNNRQRVANQHIQSIESAYPHIQGALVGGAHRANLIQHLEDLM